MKVAVLGATGRTGTLVVRALRARSHEVVVLARPSANVLVLGDVGVVRGDVRSQDDLRTLLDGVDAVISAVGPVGRDPGIMHRTAVNLVQVMGETGVERFIGVSVAGLDVVGDKKGRRDAAISWLMNTFGGALAADRRLEYETWNASGAAWTLLRVPRLVDHPAGPVHLHPRQTGRRTTLSRHSLARLLVTLVESDSFLWRAPFVSDE